MADTLRVDGVAVPATGPGGYDRGSIRVIKEAMDGNIGTGTISIRDDDPQAVYGGRSIKITVDGSTLIDGYLGTLEDDRDGEPLTIHQTYSIQDRNLKLGHRNVNKWKRPGEYDVARIRALMAKYAPGIDAYTYVTTTTKIWLPPETYEDTQLDQVMRDILEWTGKTWWLDDEDRLHYHRINESAGYDCTLEVLDTAPDGITQFAPSRPHYSRDPYNLTNKVRVYNEKRAVVVRDEDSIARHNAVNVRREEQLSYPEGDTTLSLKQYANAILGERATEREVYRFALLHQTDPTLVQPGMRIKITSAVMGLTAQWKHISRVTYTTRAPGVWAIDIECGVPRRRRRGKKQRLKQKQVEPPADTDQYSLDGFNREVAPPSIAAGSSAGSFSLAGQAETKRVHVIAPWVLEPDQDDTIFVMDPGFAFNTGKSEYIYSGSNDWQPWTSRPGWAGGGGLNYTATGYHGTEQWWKMTVGAHPASMSGMRITVSTSGGSSYGEVGMMDVVVNDAEPTGMRQGTVVATVKPGETVTVDIPPSLIPAEGQELWVGYRTSWVSAYEAATYDWYSGWPSPSGFESWQVDSAGGPYNGLSGAIVWSAGPASATWLTITGDEPDWGSIKSSDDTGAPFEGDIPWESSGATGAPDAYGMTDGAIYLTATSSASKAWTLAGDTEDDTGAIAPWNDFGWAGEISFSTDAAGLTGQTGERSIVLETVGVGQRASATIHLGDGGFSSGISVNGPGSTDYAGFAIAADTKYRAKVDTRAGVIRAKIWEDGKREPAEYTVEAALDGTNDDTPLFRMTINAGNVVSQQTVRVHSFAGQAKAADGDLMAYELLGRASGNSRYVYPSHRFRRGSLRVYSNGVASKPKKEWPSGDGSAGPKALLDRKPTAGMIMRARYVVVEAYQDG